MSSTRERKRAAADRLRTARSQGRSALDEWDAEAAGNDDAVYDVVDEDEYRQLVESRRGREDFVVDDEGLGYHDDGEEHYGAEGEATSDRTTTKSKSATASLTQQALRRARKAKQSTAVSALSATGVTAADGMRNTSMWDFVNQAPGASAATVTGTGATAHAKRKKCNNAIAPNVDDLLAELDQEETMTSGSNSSRKKRKVRRKTTMTKRHPVQAMAHRTTVTEQQDNERDNDGDDNDDQPMIFDDEDDDDDDDYTNKYNDHSAMQDDTTNANAKVEGHDDDDAKAKIEGSSSKQVRFSDKKEIQVENDEANHEAEEQSRGNQEAPRRRRKTSLLGNVSAPAKQAMEKKAAAAAKLSMMAATTSTPSILPHVDLGTTNIPNVDVASAASSSFAMGSSAGQLQLSDVLTGPDSTDHVDFYWMDVCETRQGQIMLFGKVAHGDGTFVSAGVVVENCCRNLFCLPRPGADMLDVHAEVNALLAQHVLPKTAGTSWKGKVVKRAYAFDDATLPRDATDYLKIVYDARYPALTSDICQRGGETFSRILNANVSLTETFILKRKLMGPCWLRLHQPSSTAAPLTWTRLEVRVASPKHVTRLDLVDGVTTVPPAPPVSTLTVQFKTVVHPTTHQSEIVSLTALLHSNVPLEAGSPSEHAKYIRHLSLVRALPTAEAGIPTLPRNWESDKIQKMPNERALLSRFLAQVHQWDPDVWIGHNVWGYGMEVLLQRAAAHKLKSWSQMGRRRQTALPKGPIKDWAIAQAMTGRLLCDTYLSAKELLRETTYSLTALAASQLQTARPEIESVDLPLYFATAKGVTDVCHSTFLDAQLVQKLAFKLQTLPLTKQLTNIAGNLWSHTLKSNRAERTEYLLLHEFHRLKYLPPEKKMRGTAAAETSKAKYAGGLVLEPKKGLYDSFILLLDFNSLYPSLIQEYNLCFTTLNWAAHQAASAEDEEANDDMPLPDPTQERGVLPRVIQSLVEARRNVKKFLKSEKDTVKKQELDIRQKALKLTANSMYGCLGFSHSRFFAQPIAAKVTQLGRETLQKTVDIAQNTVGLDVIYGDTDSIMINTRLNQDEDLAKVAGLGEAVKREVNKLYRTLELEIDGIFRSMLLLKKKKYAAKTVEEQKDGKVIKYGQELKGLDLVRRDWCVQSKDTGRYVTEEILSGQENEVVLHNIHTHLEDLAKKMRSGELALDKYVITKGLSKHPKDYPDGKSLPHVQVAKQMLQNNRPVNTGDHIPYIITEHVPPEPLPEGYKVPSATERARHPEEIIRSNGALKPDIEWYLTQQILPPIARLCDPIDGTSQQELAHRLGLDSTRYANGSSGVDLDADQDIDYKPASSLPDEERFKDVEKLRLYCLSCRVENEFPGVFSVHRDGTVVSGMVCPNPDCRRPAFWGHDNYFDCYARIANSMAIWTYGLTCRYYRGSTYCCDEPSCALVTRQLSVTGPRCLRRGCPGTLQASTSERAVHTHLKYLERLVSIDHAAGQLALKGKHGTLLEIKKILNKHEKTVFQGFHEMACKSLESTAYNWITPTFWRSLFRVGNKQ